MAADPSLKETRRKAEREIKDQEMEKAEDGLRTTAPRGTVLKGRPNWETGGGLKAENNADKTCVSEIVTKKVGSRRGPTSLVDVINGRAPDSAAARRQLAEIFIRRQHRNVYIL